MKRILPFVVAKSAAPVPAPASSAPAPVKEESQRPRRMTQYIPTSPIHQTPEPGASVPPAAPVQSVGNARTKHVQTMPHSSSMAQTMPHSSSMAQTMAHSSSMAQTMQETRDALAATEKVLEGLNGVNPGDDRLDAMNAESFFAAYATTAPSGSEIGNESSAASSTIASGSGNEIAGGSTSAFGNESIHATAGEAMNEATSASVKTPISSISTPVSSPTPLPINSLVNPSSTVPLVSASSMHEVPPSHIQPFVPSAKADPRDSIQSATIHFSFGGHTAISCGLGRIPNSQEGEDNTYDLHTFPGPLTQGKKRDKALQYIQMQIDRCSTEDWQLLWGVLKILIESNGVVNSNRS